MKPWPFTLTYSKVAKELQSLECALRRGMAIFLVNCSGLDHGPPKTPTFVQTYPRLLIRLTPYRSFPKLEAPPSIEEFTAFPPSFKNGSCVCWSRIGSPLAWTVMIPHRNCGWAHSNHWDEGFFFLNSVL